MEQHDYIVLLEKFFKKEASSEEKGYLLNGFANRGFVMSLIRFASRCGKKQLSK